MERYFFYKIKKIRIIDITFIGLMLALYLVLDIASGWSFGPFYLGLNIKYIPLFVVAAYTDWLRTFVLCILANIICFFFPTNWDQAKPLAYIFDYTIPILTPVLVSFFAPRNYNKKARYIGFWVVILIFQFLVAWFSKTVGGVLFYSADKPEDKGLWIWSFSVNFVNQIVDLVFFIPTVPTVCYVLRPLKSKIYKDTILY